MGLDWILIKTKARPGSERRFAEISELWAKMREDGVGPAEALLAEFEAVSMTCYEMMGAPRVGIDEEATEFFRTQVYEPARADAEAGKGTQEDQAYWTRPYEVVLEDNRGRWVVDLAKDKSGIGAVRGVFAGALDFRGNVVGMSEELLGAALAQEAYEDHSAEECLDYAMRLEKVLSAVRDEDARELWEAVGWLRFWGDRGFGFLAWS